MHQSVNFSHGDEQNTCSDQYMPSPIQNVVSESFDARAFKKLSSNVEDSYKNLKDKTFSNHGVWTKLTRPGSQYGINNENECVEVWNTWDNRNSSSYVAKGYMKPKQASYSKKPIGYHKKNKSQHNSRIIPTRASSSLASYSFNTNRSNLSKPKIKDRQWAEADPKQLSNKGLKQKSSRHQTSYISKADQYLKNYSLSKKTVSSSHLRNMSAIGSQKSWY